VTTETSSTPAPDTTPAIPTDAAGLTARDQELTALYEHDRNRYQYEGGGRWANEHLAVRKAQQAEADKATSQQTQPPPEGDGLTDEDVSAINLDTQPDGEADGEESDAGDDAEPGVKPIGPGDDATDEELDAWRAEHGVPDDPTDYEAPEVEGIEWDQEALSPILEAVHAHNIPQQAVADALAKYAERIKAQRAEIKQRDIANAKAVRSELGEAEIAAVKAAAKAMPAELRTLLNEARAPDGSRIINNVDVIRMISAAYGSDVEHQATPHRQDNRTMLQQELAELHAIRDRDISEYWRPWRGTGKSGSDRALEITRLLGDEAPARPSASDLRSEERDLIALRNRDPEMFRFGNYRNTGRPASDRLVAIQTGRG
jgi:hypothetical protein